MKAVKTNGKTNRNTKSPTLKDAVRDIANGLAAVDRRSAYMAANEVNWVRGSSSGNTAYGIAIDDKGQLVQLCIRKDIDGLHQTSTPVTVQEAAARMAEIVKHEITFNTDGDIHTTDLGQIAFFEMVANQDKVDITTIIKNGLLAKIDKRCASLGLSRDQYLETLARNDVAKQGK